MVEEPELELLRDELEEERFEIGTAVRGEELPEARWLRQVDQGEALGRWNFGRFAGERDGTIESAELIDESGGEGVGAGFLGPLVFGVVLDGTGGKDDAAAWGYAFGSLGLACACGPLAVWLTNRKDGKT